MRYWFGIALSTFGLALCSYSLTIELAVGITLWFPVMVVCVLMNFICILWYLSYFRNESLKRRNLKQNENEQSS